MLRCVVAGRRGAGEDLGVAGRGFRELCEEQSGVVTRAQAQAAGLTWSAIRHRLSSSRWQRLHPGVFATFSGPVPRQGMLWAAVLAAGRDAVLSHETAAELHGFTDRPDAVVHVTVPTGRRATTIAGAVVHESCRARRARHGARLPPQTRIEETIVDLTQTARTLDDAYGWISRGVSRRLTTVSRLLAAISERRKLRWRLLLREGLGDVADGALSVLERRYLQDVERAHGLPTAVRQVPVAWRGGRNYLDAGYAELKTRVELDGRAFHPFDERHRDFERDNAAVRAGEVPLRYGTSDVLARPCELAAEIADVLRGQGWRGRVRRCHRRSCVIGGSPYSWAVRAAHQRGDHHGG